MKISIREGTSGDAQAIARVHVASWQATYRGIIPQPLLDALDVNSRAEDWKNWFTREDLHVFVAENNGGICGFSSGGKPREPIQDFDAEIYAIYFLPSAKGQGAGKLLVQRLVQALRTDGFTKLAVWVLAENPSRSFYEHLGASQIMQKPIQIGDAELVEIVYGWQNLQFGTDTSLTTPLRR